MTLLLVLSGLLLVCSGLVALRTMARAGLGVPILALIQVVAGAGVALWAMLSQGGGGSGLRVVVGSVGLVVVSGFWLGARVSAARRVRVDSEGARLVTYVKYLSSRDAGD